MPFSKEEIEKMDEKDFCKLLDSANEKILKELSRLDLYGVNGALLEREIKVRATNSPHITIIPSFIVGLLAMVFSAITAWPILREWFEKPDLTDSLIESSENATNQKIIEMQNLALKQTNSVETPPYLNPVLTSNIATTHTNKPK